MIILEAGMTRVNIELATKTGIEAKIKYQNKNRDRDDSYDQIRGRSKEKDYLCDDDDIFHSKIERNTQNFANNESRERNHNRIHVNVFWKPRKNLDNIHSPADVDQLIAERIEYAKSQKAEDVAKDPHVNIRGISSQSYESINVDLDLAQDTVDPKCKFG